MGADMGADRDRAHRRPIRRRRAHSPGHRARRPSSSNSRDRGRLRLSKVGPPPPLPSFISLPSLPPPQPFDATLTTDIHRPTHLNDAIRAERPASTTNGARAHGDVPRALSLALLLLPAFRVRRRLFVRLVFRRCPSRPGAWRSTGGPTAPAGHDRADADVRLVRAPGARVFREGGQGDRQGATGWWWERS